MVAGSALIKSLEDTMRTDAGLNGDAQYIEQITWLIFLKAFDAKEMEWELSPNYRQIIPTGYRWRDWAADPEGITGEGLLSFVTKLFSELSNLDVSDNDARKYAVKNVFSNVNNYMKSGTNLRNLINKINRSVDFIDATKKHTFNDLYEGMLKDLQSAGKAGEFYTPRAVTEFVVEMINPKIGEKILDPACGTGGFLTCALNHLGTPNSTKELTQIQENIIGWEKKPLPYLLAMTNLILHDIDTPNIFNKNSLKTPLSEYTDNDRVDVIVTNPPYGGSENETIKKNFPLSFQTSETANLFVVLNMHLLKPNGRCGIVLPDGLLFGDGATEIAIKEKLLTDCGLHTIIRLPPVFKPYANIYTNLLFFQKGVKSGGIWFYRLDMPEGYKHFSKTKPILSEHFNPVREWWDNRCEIIDPREDETFPQTYKAKWYSFNELKERKFNIDCCGYPKENEIVLPLNELLEMYHKQKAEHDAKIETILKEVTKIVSEK